jgi:hypothetical protein
MKIKTKYFLAGALLTFATILLHYFLLSKDNRIFLPIIIILFNSPNFFLAKKGEFTKPIKLQCLKCSVKDFLSMMTVICTIALFLIIFLQLSEDEARKIAGKWYFLFTLWLLQISALITKYITNKKSNDVVSANLDPASAESK